MNFKGMSFIGEDYEAGEELVLVVGHTSIAEQNI